jgi:hypothetical protein
VSRPAQGARAVVALSIALATSSCVTEKAQPEAPPEPSPVEAKGNPVFFAFEASDGKPLTADSLRGRVTVIGLATTYDFASQAEARFLAGIARHHVPRVNVALLILEPPDARPLVEAFAHTLDLPYPVALVDAATTAGQGPFPGLRQVPSVVVLDPLGREVYRHVGLVEEQPLEKAIREVEALSR